MRPPAAFRIQTDMPSQNPRKALEKKPLWMQIEEALVEDINNGVYPVGSNLPTELELCRVFKASRHTVRAALGSITRMGLIKRAPHWGTVVIATGENPRFEMYLPQLGSIDEEAVKYPRTVLSIEQEKCSAELAEELGFDVKTPLLRLNYVRLTPLNNDTVAFCRTWLVNAHRDLVDEVQIINDTPLVLILERMSNLKCHSIHQTFQVATLPADVAEKIHFPADQAVLLVTRYFLNHQHKPIAVAQNYYLEGDFAYGMNIERKQEAVVA